MNSFGGNWTKIKIEILVNYAKAYLKIMKGREYFDLLYFDGFAGSGSIVKDDKVDIDLTVGAAKRIIEINDPMPFDKYYFVEKDKINFESLKKSTKDEFPSKKIFLSNEDCNKKLIDLSNFLRDPKNKNVRTLAYIDPCGMQVEWRSLESLKNLNLDMWILVPTGMGVNRLLKKNGEISDVWLNRLEKFLGIEKREIKDLFYTKTPTLFEEFTDIRKEDKAIEKSAILYADRLKEIFEYVSKPYELRNTNNSIMYHLFLTTNNNTAVKIANDIVKKYNN
ncbi:MAG TPA: three-Cys-motif partner protein TcmP [Balneolales bacterium]|nr:three-Cys-motif partner protein TcmP [Balneolales bacterium]